MWYVGLDWADTHHDLVVLDEAGHRVGWRRVAHSKQGLEELKQFLLSIASDPLELACIVETSHGLLITFLLEAGIPVYPVNPKTVNQLRKREIIALSSPFVACRLDIEGLFRRCAPCEYASQNSDPRK